MREFLAYFLSGLLKNSGSLTAHKTLSLGKLCTRHIMPSEHFLSLLFDNHLFFSPHKIHQKRHLINERGSQHWLKQQ